MDGLYRILEDRTHGSTFLISSFLELVIDEEIDHSNLADASKKMMTRFSDMQIIISILNKLHNAPNLKSEAVALRNILQKGSKIIADKLIDILPQNPILLTHSHSQAVVDVLNLLRDKIVFCKESLPGGEGAEMAEIVSGEMIEDENIKYFLNGKKVDAIVFGCDQYDKNTVVNKVGSKDLTLLARKYQIPVYVITSSLKEVQTVSEILKDEWLEAFERDLVTDVITD